MFKKVITLAVLCVAAMSVSAQEMNLARNENAIGQAVAAKLLTAVYKKAGLGINIQPLPGARANAVATSGEKDGEVARIQAYADKNPSLIKVEPGYYFLTTAAFAKSDSGIVITSKADLKKYKVGIVRGIAHAEAATDGLPGLQVANTYEQLYQMVDAGRVEVGIDEGINGPVTLKKLGLTSIKQVGEIAKLDLFNMLNSKQKDVAPRISAAIKALKDSGELAVLTKQYESEYLK